MPTRDDSRPKDMREKPLPAPCDNGPLFGDLLKGIEESTTAINIFPNRLRRIYRLCQGIVKKPQVSDADPSEMRLIEGFMRNAVAQCQSWVHMTAFTQLVSLKGELDAFEKHARDFGVTIIQLTEDEEQRDRHTVSSFLKTVLVSSDRSCIWELQGHQAEYFLTLLLEQLDSQGFDAKHRKVAIKIMTRLAKRSERFPQTLWLFDVDHEKNPFDGGSFGDVYKGHWDGKIVAVKYARYFTQQSNIEANNQFYQESLLWRQLSHPYILPFFGIYQDGPRMAMVSSFQSNGNIMKYLRTNPHVERHNLVIQVASGLLYLHEEGIVHSDLKGGNILIGANGTALLADFGLSRIQHGLSGSFSSTVSGGTFRYKAPELFVTETRKPTQPSDIWALGMVIYEVFTEKAPFSEFFSEPAVATALMSGDLPAKPKHTSRAAFVGFTEDLWNFLKESCWEKVPKRRHSAVHCLTRLKMLEARWAREKTARAMFPQSQVTIEAQITMQPRYARSLVDRRTSYLQSLNEEFDIRTELHKNNASLKLIGRIDGVRAAEAKIRSDMENAENQTSDTVSIPHRLHPMLIGDGGKLVQELQKKYSVNIQFNSADDQVNIRGALRDVAGARAELQKAREYHELFDDTRQLTVDASVMDRVSSDRQRILSETDLHSIHISPKTKSLTLRGSKRALQEGEMAIAKLKEEMNKEVELTLTKDFSLISLLVVGKLWLDLVVRCGGPTDSVRQTRLLASINHDHKTITLRGEPSLLQVLQQELESEAERRRQIVIGISIPRIHHRGLLRRKDELARIHRETGAFIHLPGSRSYDELDPENPDESAEEDIVKIRGTRADCTAAERLLRSLLKAQRLVERERIFKAKYHHYVEDLVRGDMRALGIQVEFFDVPPRPLSPKVPTPALQWHISRRFDDTDFTECTWLLKAPTNESLEKGLKILKEAVEETSSASCIGFLTLPTSVGFGHIVGPGGQTVKSLQNQFKTSITVPKSGTGTTIIIVGSGSALESARDSILQRLEQASPWRTVGNANANA